jgi:hypothetical protein
MSKKQTIKAIQKIINEFGSFTTGELQAEVSPCVGAMGKFVALAEQFRQNVVDVSVYEPAGFSSDPIDEYEATYEELTADVLEEILILAEQFEAESLKTEKRISN